MNINERAKGYKDILIYCQEYLTQHGQWMYLDFLTSLKIQYDSHQNTDSEYLAGVYDVLNSEIDRLKHKGYSKKNLKYGEYLE